MSTDLFEKGLEIRKQVLGEEYVANALANMNSFSRPLQELVTEFCWGKIWGREGLTLRERSMLNLAMISILNRSHELKIHVRGALRNGVTPEAISEIFLQVAVYGGIPAGMEAFRVAGEVLAESARVTSPGE